MGETAEDRQRWRDQILNTNKADLEAYATKLTDVIAKGSVVVFGSQSALEQANKEVSTPLEIESVFSK